MIALILLSLAQTSPRVELPAELTAKPGRLIQISAKSEQKTIRWFLAGGEADLIVMESTRTAIFSATDPGNYKIVAYSAAGDVPSDPAVCVVVVGDMRPTPPAPFVPVPVDPLATALAAIWGGLQEPDRMASKSGLTEAFRQGVVLADDKALLDLGAFTAALRKVRMAKVPDGKLMAIRERIGEELATLGEDSQTAFGPELRAKAKAICARVVAALEALK